MNLNPTFRYVINASKNNMLSGALNTKWLNVLDKTNKNYVSFHNPFIYYTQTTSQ